MTNFSASVDQLHRPPAFDVLHRRCWEAIRTATHASDTDFPHALEDMLKQLTRTFRIEEGWMEDTDHPALLPHRAQHARVLAALHHVQSAMLQGDATTGRHAVGNLLPKWLALHIDTMDNMLPLSLTLRFEERRRTPSRRASETATV